MREVSCRATSILLEALTRSGLAVEPLVELLPVSVEHLRDPARRVDWDVFAMLCDGVEQACEGVTTLEAIGEGMLTVPSFGFLRQAGRMVVTPRQLYGIAGRLMAPVLFPHITLTQTWLPSGRLVLSSELPQGYRASHAFFRIAHANMTALPRLLGLPPSQLEEQCVTGRLGRLILVPPRSHTLGARLRRGARTLLGLGHALRGVERQQGELQASLEALRSSRHELRQLVERLPDGVLIHGDGIVRWANAAMIALLGYGTLEEVAGKNILEFLEPAERARTAADLARAAPRAVNDDSPEYRIALPDGTHRRLQAGTTQHVEFEGAPARLVVVRDVTERYRMQEQLALADRLATVGTVAAGVAHEINNPLAYLQMNLELALQALAAPGPPAVVGGHIRTALEGAERVRRIVRDLKTLSRAQDDQTEAVNLPALLDSMLMLAASALTPKARVVRRYDRAPLALGSSGRLGQVFLNLLLNAADAIPPGLPLRHEIRVSTATDAQGRAIVEIADTGAGIPPEIAARIFDPFFTTKASSAGTGLGLAICRQLVTGLGGEISFTSQHGEGTVFRVVLPAANTSTIPVACEANAAPPLPRRRVLVVDDEPALLRSLSAILGSFHDVVAVSSGREAVDVLRDDGRFDAVLTDLMMAHFTGMDLYEVVRAARPGMERRIVFMTGGAFTADGRAFLAKVPNRCLEKPFEKEEVLAALGEIVAT